MASKIIGIAMQNFTAAPKTPDATALIDYGIRVEELGYESIWVWDHILLGVEPYFPILDSLSILTAVAARTERIRLGTGVLVLPARNPVVLAKQLSSIDQISKGRLTPAKEFVEAQILGRNGTQGSPSQRSTSLSTNG